VSQNLLKVEIYFWYSNTRKNQEKLNNGYVSEDAEFLNKLKVCLLKRNRSATLQIQISLIAKS
jgi:hypothetical protein